MRTRKTFNHEDGIYEGGFRLPEPRENHSREMISLNDSYDWYPEKQSAITKEPVKFEVLIDLPLVEGYKLKSQIDNFSHTNHRDAFAMAAVNEEINNLAV